VSEALTLALPKGRVLEDTLPFLSQAGVDLRAALAQSNRRLRLDLDGFHVLLVKPVDVPTYVERGVAQIGIAGLDTIEEAGHDLHVPVDLGVARCRMSVARPADAGADAGRRPVVRVATKYPNIARRHYRSRGRQAEIIPLFGSVELGPLTDLSDEIVDVVQSGQTLIQNGLEEVETIFESSARLIVHPAAMKLARSRVSEFLDRMREAVARSEAGPQAAGTSDETQQGRAHG
jgi:ATP phosphoribosyltransferase